MPLIEVNEDTAELLSRHEAETGERPGEVVRRLLEGENPMIRARGKPRRNSALARFLRILVEIQEQYPDEFHKVAAVEGRSRIYFSKHPDMIKSSGMGNKPVHIGESDWWVTSNTSTETKVKLLQRVFAVLRCPTGDCERWMKSFMDGEKVALMTPKHDDAEDDPFRI
jgi:negative regulator of replication initiation